MTAGPRAIGVVLSGVLDDGAAGLRAIVGRGGLAVVQDPADALYSGMPQNALSLVDTEHVMRGGEIGVLLDKLVRLDPAGRYRCRIGHAWPAQALLGAHDDEVRFALQKALRALDEKAELARKPAAQFAARPPGGLSERYAASAREAADAAETLRRFLLETSERPAEEAASP
ncbi:chemotaxis protein CheB [Amycolatopsis sp. lyj-346]|uniref:chemotaxis protein CheB n=1 Tax=Amycolatopsis sp. lyj-346 TaxID=2789289 RepID=UPI00397D7E32